MHAAILLLFGLALASGTARADPAACLAAIAAVEQAQDLPAGLLAAIATAESGRRLPGAARAEPWPWAINIAGESRYAESRGWKVELISLSENDLGGLKEVTASITGEGVFARLKFESGVHRVQRVPVTEASGRIHTSAATVAVLPEAEEVDLDIRPEEIRIDTMRASGAGGQHVNKTESAVRITHLPTGLIVVSAEKSQHQNRRLAMQVLRARLYEMQREKLANERSAQRKDQVGSGDRSQRIRTYNFPQGRITDHRINLTLHKLEQVLEGPALEELIEALITDHQATQLAAMEADARQ